MPPDASENSVSTKAEITGRCYCGAVSVSCTSSPLETVLCHCNDCRRITGAAVAAFSGFKRGDVSFASDLCGHIEKTPGVERWFCASCGSPIAATFAYLPDQMYLSVGLLDQAADLRPGLHTYADNILPWLCLSDDLPKTTDSGAAVLSKADKA